MVRPGYHLLIHVEYEFHKTYFIAWTLSLFVDGQTTGAPSVEAKPVDWTNISPPTMYIGSNGKDLFTGVIDEVKNT